MSSVFQDNTAYFVSVIDFAYGNLYIYTKIMLQFESIPAFLGYILIVILTIHVGHFLFRNIYLKVWLYKHCFLPAHMYLSISIMVYLNAATEAELRLLPGVDDKKAAVLLQLRGNMVT